MESITLKQTQGRGRNGWFRAREAQIEAHEKYVCLDVVSSRPSYPGPVRLELSTEDATALGRGLLQTVPATAGFSDPRSAVSALDAFLQAIANSPWLDRHDQDAIRVEVQTLKEVVSLSGGTEAKTDSQ